MYGEILQRSLELDSSLITKFGILLECEGIEQELGLGNLLIEPLIEGHCTTPKHCRLSSLQIDVTLLSEWKSMLSLLHSVNEDRKNLRKVATHLLVLLSKGEVPRSPFESFISKTQNLHYELLKNFIEKERKQTEKLEKELQSYLSVRKNEISTQTESLHREELSNVSDITLQLDCSITSDTTSSPLNSSINMFRTQDLSFNSGPLTERTLKRPGIVPRLSVIVKPQKKIEESKTKVPVVRKTLPRKTTKN